MKYALIEEKGQYALILRGEGMTQYAVVSDLVSCDSLENGVIMLYNKIISKVRAAQDILLSEEEIDAILLSRPIQGVQEAVPVVERVRPGICFRPVERPAGTAAGASHCPGDLCGRRIDPAQTAH